MLPLKICHISTTDLNDLELSHRIQITYAMTGNQTYYII